MAFGRELSGSKATGSKFNSKLGPTLQYSEIHTFLHAKHKTSGGARLCCCCCHRNSSLKPSSLVGLPLSLKAVGYDAAECRADGLSASQCILIFLSKDYFFSPNCLREVDAALAGGPLSFGEIMVAVGSRDGREVVRSLESLRQVGRLVRGDDGHYSLAET